MNRQRIIAIFAALILTAGVAARADDIPLPDLSDAQPQVREKILASHARVEAGRGRSEAWGRYGMVLHAHSCLTEAAHAYAAARRLSPKEYRWPYFEAIVSQKVDPRRALELFDAARAIDPDYVPALIHRGRLLETLGDRVAAEQSYARAVELDPDSCPALLHQGKLALQNGDLSVAVTALEAAARLAPEDRAVLATLARVYQRAGRRADARAVAERARSAEAQTPFSDPLYAEVRWEAVNIRAFQQRATALRDKGDFAAARRELVRAERFAPDDPSVQAALAEIHWREGNLLAAVTAGRRALASDMRFDDLHQVLAIVHFELDHFDEADHHAVIALRETPDDPDLHVIRGEALTRRGEIDAAIGHLEVAVTLKPDADAGRLRLGQLLARQGRLDEAVT
ncbi:MAG: tetratricopeptide repeat protein, partial [Phycisphaerales bacterium]|nr:tetratricopeptide repeat protein [Phycisphaerales bacterium]